MRAQLRWKKAAQKAPIPSPKSYDLSFLSFSLSYTLIFFPCPSPRINTPPFHQELSPAVMTKHGNQILLNPHPTQLSISSPRLSSSTSMPFMEYHSILRSSGRPTKHTQFSFLPQSNSSLSRRRVARGWDEESKYLKWMQSILRAWGRRGRTDLGGGMGLVKVQKASLSWFTIIWVSVCRSTDRRSKTPSRSRSAIC